MGIVVVLYLAVIVLAIAGLWKTFVKAGKPGWGAIVPVYNVILMLEIAGRPLWWVLLFFIPCVSIVVAFLVCIDIAKKFGKELGGAAYITKPVDLDELEHIIKEKMGE